MNALVTVAFLEQQLADIAESKRKLHATWHQLNMSDLEVGVEAMEPPSSCPMKSLGQEPANGKRAEDMKPPSIIPPQFVKIHIPKLESQAVAATGGAMKPEPENGAATENGAAKPAIEMLPPPASKPRRKRSLSPRTAKPAKEADGPNKFEAGSKKSRVSTPLPLQIEQLRIKADRLHIGGNLVQAGLVYISAINLSGPWTERSMHASLHFNSAVCHIKQESYDEAISHATQAVKLEPTFVGAHYALGHAIGKGGKNLQLAMRSFKHVLKLRPEVRVQLPNGILFGSKDHPLYSEGEALIVYQRQSCAHLKVAPGWTTRESRSQPGKIFFENLQTRATTWIVPEEKKRRIMSLSDALAASSGSSRKIVKRKGAAAFLGA